MEPNMGVNPRLRPVDNLLVASFRLILRHWGPLLVTEAVVFFVTGIIIVAAFLIFGTPVLLAAVKGTLDKNFLKYFFSVYFWIGMAVILIPTFVLHSWGGASMISALGFKGEGMAPVGHSLKRGLKLLIPFLLLTILVSGAYFGGLILLVFPAVILMVGLSLAWYIVVLEDVSVFKAFGTSWEITRGYRSAIFGRACLLILIVFGSSMMIVMISMVPIMGFVSIPVQFLLNLLITPYMLAYCYLIYEDIRAGRKGVYSMGGGIISYMLILWIVGVAFCGGIIMLVVYLLQRYAHI